MTNAGHCILARYKRTQDHRDLDQAIKHFECASDLCPVDHPYRPATLSNLATAKFVSCQVNGTYLDLDIPISLFQDALDMRPTGHPDRPLTQLHLAIALLSRFAKRGFQADADAAKELLNEVGNVSLADSHVSRAALLSIETSALVRSTDANTLGAEGPIASMLPWSPSELARRAELCLRTDDLHAVDEVISLHYDALGYYSTANDQRGQLLCNVGLMLATRFNRRGNSQDLDKAIAFEREALALHPIGHTDRYEALNNLVNQLSTRFELQGNDQDLDDGIMLNREALALHPVGDAKFWALNNLANALSTRFKHRGSVQGLDEAIVHHREALALCPVGHKYRYGSLNNLANQLSIRFQHRGNDQDLDLAIVLQREALALCPVGHTHRSLSSDNLANQLFIRFQHRGNDQDLDEAIVLNREALALCPVGHTNRSASLNSLASQLSPRFEHRGNDQDLDEAIMLLREALALCPVGHADRSVSLIHLAARLSTRFKEHRGNDQDLDEPIVLLKEALALYPVGHKHRYMSLNSLAIELSTRFKHRGNDQDLDQAIVLHREALALCPVGHTHRFMSLNNLAGELSIRYEHRRNDQDLQESLQNLRCALTLLTQHDPRQLGVRRSLAAVYLLAYQSGLGEHTEDLNTAMHHLKVAANSVSGGLLARLRTSLSWVRHADQHSHGTDLEARATSIQLLDAFMSATASVSSRHRIMKEFPSTLAVNAASCALRRGDVCRAVELLEQGRTLIWTQMARFRTPLDSLQDRGVHAEALMKKFRDLSSVLDRPPSNHPEGMSRVDVEAEATRYRRGVENWNTALDDIRKIEGFDRFLLAPLFSELQDAARDGPIIILIASKSFCDAIIVSHQDPPITVGLAITVEKLVQLVIALQRTVRNEQETQAKLVETLRQLWVEVVNPVVENLAGVAERGSRIWWCPTFTLQLPAFARRWRIQGRWKVSFRSYMFLHTLHPLLRSSRLANVVTSLSSCPSLPSVRTTHQNINILWNVSSRNWTWCRASYPLPQPFPLPKVTSADSTKSTALLTLRDNHWVHFACHGTQNSVEPFKSAFLMRDEPLQLQDISHSGSISARICISFCLSDRSR
ncbi:uncharacterized protein EDB91DRAFT_666783 [Suillus paluster]|uniref:uncharacterized protein n=1 Tax=Suillus paluster TaxID=48578 RepID=UPI001B872D47|nr:uncharacterized protein EDB91DRAFT_666783 [Suillus paluster]KAG1732666.1 hypothetical protein EDB91DRAFT_666783 [Suillus paluster]